MTDAAPYLAVTALTKTFPGRAGAPALTAVDGVSFSLDRGESLGIVGESGSGKTTVARMIMGLEAPTGGSISLDGVQFTGRRLRLAERRARAHKIQIVFQDPYSSLDPRQNVRSAVGEIVDLHGRRSDRQREERVSELLDQVGLDERQSRARPRDLSGGQRQRVAIARALAAEPAVLILDESVAALDVSVQAQVLNLLADIQAATGLAYLFITHDLAVVRQVTDRALVLRLGRCVEAGATADILDHPRDAYTAGLRASVPGPGWRPVRRPVAQELAADG